MTIEEHIRDAAADIARLRPSDPQGIETVLRILVKHERELCAQVADDYGRDGRLSKEYACEVADELAARIRARTN